jgi:hypothetical protein
MAENPTPSTILKEIDRLLGEYLTINPDADNPLDYVYVLGLDGVLNVLEEANNRKIVFIIEEEAEDRIEYKIIDSGNE